MERHLISYYGRETDLSNCLKTNVLTPIPAQLSRPARLPLLRLIAHRYLISRYLKFGSRWSTHNVLRMSKSKPLGITNIDNEISERSIRPHVRSLRVHPVSNLVVLKRGSTWASVLKTTSVSGIYSLGEKRRYKYFRVSAFIRMSISKVQSSAEKMNRNKKFGFSPARSSPYYHAGEAELWSHHSKTCIPLRRQRACVSGMP